MDHREAILGAFDAALREADATASVLRYCRRTGDIVRIGDREEADLAAFGRIVMVGAGKASVGLAKGALAVFGDRRSTGSLVTKDGYASSIPRIRVVEAGHPVPDDRSVAAADAALSLARSCGPNDLLLCLLSGGASALWAAPPASIPLHDLGLLTGRLLESGAPIEELNVVRRHLSRIAGGRLALASNGARLVTLAISDVVDAPADVIGSGPTLPDHSAPEEALAVLRRHEIDPPISIRRYLERSAAEHERDRPAVDEDWRHRSFHVIASIDDALDAATRSLRARGYDVRVLDRRMRGEAREVASRVAETALQARLAGASRLALLWGGETTVTVRGPGTGGRNQEIALAAAIHLAQQPEITIAALATDGSDGPTDAAGGYADSGTVSRAAMAGCDARTALRENDSNTFLRSAGDLVTTGPTRTNVNDLVFALIR
jgi:hydroxypyruvate reductase